MSLDLHSSHDDVPVSHVYRDALYKLAHACRDASICAELSRRGRDSGLEVARRRRELR